MSTLSDAVREISMPSFNDATCPRCRRRFGWAGETKDCPPCPKCGYQIPKEEMEEVERMLEAETNRILGEPQTGDKT
jgi:tRNA(Ile2) C34 agmatinyltransferase TiaS